MARKKGNRVSEVLDRAASAAIKAAMVQLSRLSDQELAEVERQLDIAYLYAKKDDMPYEDWRHTAHYSTFTYAWVLAVLAAVGERRRRRMMEQVRLLEQASV